MPKRKAQLRLFFQLLILTGFCLSSSAQQKLVRSYSVKDGLASNTVYRALVDRKGYLWFTTDAGVSRFDGTTFTNFSANDGLADNDVFGIFEDGDGRIWFLCFYQQPCFYYKGKIYNAGNFKELQKIKNYNWHMVFTDENEVWFSGIDEIYRFKDNHVTDYSLKNTNRLVIMTRIGSGVYALTDTSFYSLNVQAGKFEPCPDLHLNIGGNGQILDAGNGRYVLTDHIDQAHTNIYRVTINPGKQNIEKKLCCVYNKETINSTIDTQHHLLRTVFIDNSVTEKDISNDSFRTIAEYQLNSYVSFGAIDNQGNHWFTLLHGGVEMFPKTPSNRVTATVANESPSTYCSIAKMNETIAAGTSDNTLYLISNGNVSETRRENFYGKNSRILDMKMDKHNQLWLGTDNDVIVYNPASKQFHAMNILTSVKDVKYDEANDAMLFASSNGCFVISCKDNAKASYINSERTTCIAGSLTDTCWYETLNGLFTYDGIKSTPDTALSAQFNSRVTCMEQDKKKRLWVGTSSNGVFVVEHDRILFHFTPEDGLSSAICKNIFVDEHSDAWICTNLGLSLIKIDGKHFSIIKYNDKNRLVDNDVNDVLVVKDTVYVASSTGIVFFNRRGITDSYSFPVYISRIKVGDSVLVAEDSSFNLSSKQNTLNVSFSGLSYLSNGNIEYEYYIAELNNQPLHTKSNSVTYSSLSPGTYNFYVSATDVFGNHCIRPAHITFTILPEWYQLLWLRWLAALAFVGLSVFITFKYVKQIEKRKLLRAELNQTISRLELEAIHLQINPHFIFNCLNAIQNSIHKNNAETASYFINRFAKLMRKALMLSKESFISIDEESSFINNYLELEKLRLNNNFDYVIEIDKALDKNATFVPAFILQTFIENSINHGIKYLKGERGLITLHFIKTEKLEIRLTDNGIGIRASKAINQNSLSQHSSKGLELMHARVESLNKIYHRNIEVKITDNGELNKNEHGTTIIISLDLL